MIKICFVCHGNICRSPMAEFILKNKVKKLSIENKFIIESRATSNEEYGNDMHSGTKKILEENNISYTIHKAMPLQKEDYNRYNYFICMDEANVRNTLNIFNGDPENKIFKLLFKNDVEDPWYTGNFEETYEDIDKGTDKILEMFKVDIEE